jgi:hypothetical protein
LSGSLVQQLLRWASKILKGIRDPRRRSRVFSGQDGWFCRDAWDFGGSQWKSNLPEGSYFTSQLTSCVGNCLRSKFSKNRRGPANSLSSGVTQINKVAQILKVAHAEMMRLGGSANNAPHGILEYCLGPDPCQDPVSSFYRGQPLSHLGRSKALPSAIGSAVDSRYP